MTKELSKAIMNKSKAKNKYIKWRSKENFLDYQKARKICNKLNKNAKKSFFKRATEGSGVSNKKFWNVVKPFLTNKGSFGEDLITIEKDNQLIYDKKVLAELFNEHYVNIVKNSSGKEPSSLGDSSNSMLDESSVKSIIDKYSNHPSVLKIKENIDVECCFDLPKAEVEEINRILKSLNVKKATGPDGIAPKFVKMSANIIDCHLTNIINNDITQNHYSENAKTASVRPIFKKDDRTEIKNYRPVSLLNCFSKIYERYLHNKLNSYIHTFLSKFVSAYRKNYSSNHVLMHLIESWKKQLDQNKFVGAVLMDLSKAFDCIPHDLLIAKMHAYGFSLDSLTFFYSYLKRRNQSVKINDTCSAFQILISGVPQGSILGPILFNIFINDLYLWFTKAELYNFADDNTISSAEKTLENLIVTLEQESQVAINWFNTNEMIVNPDKFQALIVKKKKIVMFKININ